MAPFPVKPDSKAIHYPEGAGGREVCTKTCRDCNTEKPIERFGRSRNYRDGFKNHCKECCGLKVKQYRATPEGLAKKREADRRYKSANRSAVSSYKYAWNERNKEKKNAQAAVWQAVKKGTLVRQPCWCGDIKSEGHHGDYSKPLEVVWLCRKHHAELHRLINADKGSRAVSYLIKPRVTCSLHIEQMLEGD